MDGVFFFDSRLLLEKLLDLGFVLVEDLGALILECLLNTDEVLSIGRTKGFILLLHLVNKLIDVVVHAAHGLDIFLILTLKLLHELVNQLLLVADDLLALILLKFDLL